jgi:hypothetical protein
MERAKPLGQLDHLTFKGNFNQSRYGWLRLTPAYSIHLVKDILDACALEDERILDPFCGTGTTALVCAERGIACDTTDINPFLLWLTQVKCHSYHLEDIASFQDASAQIARVIQINDEEVWVPPLYQIEKWWDKRTLLALGRAMGKINELASDLPESVTNLLKIAFCRTMIEQANVSFGHQSMSFKKQHEPMLALLQTEEDAVMESWNAAISAIAKEVRSPIVKQPRLLLCDARNLPTKLEANCYSCVVTSPPYPNRMSYIRELRPYMYWLGYLTDGRAAGELDWQAIGGTWGCATSNLTRWTPDVDREIPFPAFNAILEQIGTKSKILSRYVYKYFHDMVLHTAGLFQVVKPGGIVNYIVGNSKFYDVMLPVEEIYASLFAAAGFEQVSVRPIRKRTSKKELFEFLISARKPL